MAADQMEAKPNVLMGKYELGRLLGQGTFAKVYHARNLKTGKSVAIKAMDKEKITRAGMIDQIKREISVMKIVRHPNIVQLFEVMASKSKIYFVMEYVKGGELFDRVAKGRLPEGEARKYFQQLISAVDFCHSRGVYHRDLKPENLLLDENGNLKISDFGLSALPEQLKQDGLLHTACGTPSYVAPEVLLKKGYDGAKADIWSCGVILFVLMAGFLPFHDENLMAMYKKIYKGEFKCPPWFSAEARRVLSKLLVPNPKARIAIPQLMETTWFKRGFKRERSFNYIDEDETSLEDVNSIFSGSNAQLDGSSSSSSSSASVKNEGLAGDGAKPACMNAFDIISLSPGFNLAGLFDDEKHRVNQESRFTTTQPASNVISKLEEIGKLRGFNTKKTDCKVKLQGSEEGRKGHLSIAAEVFELTPSLFVVEVKKAAGDTLEYNKFCKQELRPGLKDIVWTWHEDSR